MWGWWDRLDYVHGFSLQDWRAPQRGSKQQVGDTETPERKALSRENKETKHTQKTNTRNQMLNIKSAWHTTEKNNIGQADLSTFSIKDTSFSQTVYRAIMWLSNSLLVMCESNKEGTVNVCVCVFDAYFSYISLYHFILTPLLIQHFSEIPCSCVVQFSDLASLMSMSMDSVSYIHGPRVKWLQ